MASVPDGRTPLPRFLRPYIIDKSLDVPERQLVRGFKLSSSHIDMASTTRPVVFMDINIGETPAGRMKMELFSDIVPK
jgi:hypothetical protein